MDFRSPCGQTPMKKEEDCLFTFRLKPRCCTRWTIQALTAQAHSVYTITMSSHSKLLSVQSVVCQLGKVDEDNKEFSPLTNAEMKIEDDETVVSAGDPRDSPPTLSPSNSVSSISTELLEEEDEYLEYGEQSESLKQFIDLTPPQSPDSPVSPLPSLEACYCRPAGLVHNHLASYEINIHKNCDFCCDLRSKAIDFKIGEMLALDNQPFSK